MGRLCWESAPIRRKRWRNGGKNKSFFSAELQTELADYDPFSALSDRVPAEFADYDVFSKAQLLEMDIFLSNYLLSSQGDRVGMGNSIELRLPFLDYRVIEFAAKLPAHWKLKGLNEKYILKEAFKDAIPKSIGTRPKQPYRAPIREAFPTDVAGSYIHDLLSENTLRKYGYFDAKKVSLLSQRFGRASKHAANEVQNMALIGILSTQSLHRQFIDDFRPEEIQPVVPDRIIRK
jgi:asparagine synthase (glutamine-hydrolysing)